MPRNRRVKVNFVSCVPISILIWFSNFGRIPLLTEGNVSEIKTDFKRASVADVYAFIISDLRQAYEVLPDVAMQADRGRATKWSAANLLSKVYLTRGSAIKDQRGQQPTDMDSTAYFAEAVINSGKFALDSDYSMTFDQDRQKVSSETIWGVEFTNDVLFNGSEGNKMHLYWVPTYEKLPGLQRDLQQGRAWKRMRPTPYLQTQLFDHLNDSRMYKMFSWVFYANKESSIPVWKDKYYYVNENGEETGDLLYETPAELVGKPKFALGDTAAYFIPKYYGAKDYKGAVIDKAKDRQMQLDIAKAPYTLIPIDENTNHFFPCLKKWLDTQRPDMNYEQGGRNFVRMRLGETYLIAAEAYGRKGDFEKAASLINVVRKRAAYKEGEAKPQEWWQIDGGDMANLASSTEKSMLVTPAEISDDFIGFMLDEALNLGVEGIVVAGFAGKLVKLAADIMNTHSHVADGRMETICTFAALAGAERAMIERLYACRTVNGGGTASERLRPGADMESNQRQSC